MKNYITRNEDFNKNDVFAYLNITNNKKTEIYIFF